MMRTAFTAHTFSAAGWQGRMAAVGVLLACIWVLIALVAG